MLIIVSIKTCALTAGEQVLEAYNPTSVREDGTCVDKLLKNVMSDPKAITGYSRTIKPQAGAYLRSGADHNFEIRTKDRWKLVLF